MSHPLDPATVVVALAVGGFLWFYRGWRRGAARRRDQILSALGEELGWDWNGMRLLAELDGVAVTVRAPPDLPDGVLELVARTAAPPSFSFDISRSDGAAHVRLGEPFDSAFTMRSDDAALARVWLDSAALKAFRVVVLEERRFRAALRDGYVTASVTWDDIDRKGLEELARLVAAIARGDHSFAHRWSELAHHLGVDQRAQAGFPPPPILVSRQGCVVRVEITRKEDGWETVVGWTPARAQDGAREGRKVLPGIVLDRMALEKEVAEAMRVAGGSSDPYR
jgi:hypothetical protein